MSAVRAMPEDICRMLKEDLRFFRFVEESDLEILSHFISCRDVVEDEVLWEEGDEESHVVFIMTGKLEEKKQTEFEDKQMIAGVYGPGAILGEFGLLENSSRAFTAVALQNSQLLVLSRENFDRLIAEHPVLGNKLLKGMLFAISTRLKKSFDRLAAIF